MQITTEITSSAIPSDNPIHQRLLFAYHAAKDFVSGNLLEIGCGEGRGIHILSEKILSYAAIDKNKTLLKYLSQKFPNYTFIHANVPPLNAIQAESFDTVIAFQVIEHIKNDELFISELFRILKPGGKALISTPNKPMSLTRNPWHEREYTASELKQVIEKYFQDMNIYGITGNEKVCEYYEINKAAVAKFKRFDILKLEQRLPSAFLRFPYDILNRINRNKLMQKTNGLALDIQLADYSLSQNLEKVFDLFAVAQKP